MKAEVNFWCVTFYGNGEEGNREILRRIYKTAERLKQELDIGAGSVGILGELKAPSTEETVAPYVTLIRCSRKEAERVLSEAELLLGQFEFKRVLLSAGKSSSV